MSKNKKIVLIESKSFDYYSNENVWKKIEIPDLPFIPVIINIIEKENENLTIYLVTYELPYTNEQVSTKFNDIIIKSDTHSKKLRLLNEEYEAGEDTPIRLDNENIKIRNNSNTTPLEYITKKRKQLFYLNKLISEHQSPKAKRKLR